MKIIRIIVLLLMIVSCKKENEQFFEFDKVVRYTIDRNFADTILFKAEKTKNDSLTKNIIFGWHRTKNLSGFVKDLDKSHYTSIDVDTTFNSKLSQIFKEGKITSDEVTTCDPIYRDILVFKSHGKITGVTQLCFDCSIANFFGTKGNTENFGNDNEFDKLRILFKVKDRVD